MRAHKDIHTDIKICHVTYKRCSMCFGSVLQQKFQVSEKVTEDFQVKQFLQGVNLEVTNELKIYRTLNFIS